MEFLIRNAEEKDWAAVTALMSRVQEMHVAWRPDLYKPNPEMIPQAVFAKILESGTCYVAQAGEQVAGVMLVAFCHSGNASHVERDVLYIDSMAVEEGYRGRGIGRAFFETARQLCRGRGPPGRGAFLAFCMGRLYSRGMPAWRQASRVAASQTLAWTSPMWTLPSSSIHRRLWPMPPPME